ncbi:MAG: methyl-accepting chemotaxis protein [Lachnospiraceae bacterium]|nr:methyl-accepting chemotaxis protein [Lachnospiraceae bacterium]
MKESLREVAHSIDGAYAHFYEGDYRRDNTFCLYKGDEKLTGETAYLDRVREQTGVEASFYYDGQIVVTTLMRQVGGRATGLSLESEIGEMLQNGEEVFLEEYELEGYTYFGYFIPLRNGDDVVGAIFTGHKSAEVMEQVNRQAFLLGGLLSGIMLVFLAFLLVFSRYLSGSMRTTMSFLKRVAEGELNSEVKGKEVRNRDEIGDIYRLAIFLQEELKNIVSNMKNSAGSLTESAGELKEMSSSVYQSVGKMQGEMLEIASGAQQQAEETDGVVNRVSDIASQIELATREMESMQLQMQDMSTAEADSHKDMQDFTELNKDMITAVEEIANQVSITNEAVQHIQKTIDIIRDIADETNMLSINASIEAARAGELGKGFAVIAEEINNLAGQSAENAVSVEKTIISLKEESGKMVEIMNRVKSVMQEQSNRLQVTLANFSIMEHGVDSFRHSADSVKGHMEGIAESKDVILENIKNQADIAETFVIATEKVSEKVKVIDMRMGELERMADHLEEISGKLCQGLDVFKL